MNQRSLLQWALSPTIALQTSKPDQWGDVLPRRRLGSTGEAVTKLGVGGWHIGRMNECDAEATLARSSTTMTESEGVRVADMAGRLIEFYKI